VARNTLAAGGYLNFWEIERKRWHSSELEKSGLGGTAGGITASVVPSWNWRMWDEV